MSEAIGISQVQAINEPAPKTWDDYERGCMLTYRGGHHVQVELEAFQHGMTTVFNLLRSEFPEAGPCKAADKLLAACKGMSDDDIEAAYKVLADPGANRVQQLGASLLVTQRQLAVAEAIAKAGTL